MELGNLVFGNSRGEYPINRDLQDLFCLGLATIGYDGYGYSIDAEAPELVDNSVFEIRPYYWGDDETIAELPNFVAKNVVIDGECVTVEVQWYKYALRDSYSNVPLETESDIIQLFDGVLAQLKAKGYAPTGDAAEACEKWRALPR